MPTIQVNLDETQQQLIFALLDQVPLRGSHAKAAAADLQGQIEAAATVSAPEPDVVE